MSNFTLDFKNFADKSEEEVDRIIRETALGLTTAIILDTPFDKGRLKNNWIVSINKEDDRQLEDTDKSGQKAKARAEAQLSKPLGYAIWIQNNLPYSVTAEYGTWTTKPETKKTIGGYSKTSPNGMVRRNILKFNKILRSNV